MTTEVSFGWYSMFNYTGILEGFGMKKIRYAREFVPTKCTGSI